MMYLGPLTRESLSDLLDGLNSPHVDLAPLLHVDGPVRVGVNDLSALLQGGEPTFEISYEDGSLTVHRQDGGVIATLAVKF